MAIDLNQRNKKMEITLESIMWRTLLQKRSGTSRMLILKNVVEGLALERGHPIHSYIGHDEKGRPVIVSFMDGKPREGGSNDT